MKKKNFLIIIPCVLVGFFGSQYKTEASDEQKYKNLEKLCLVWGYTKYRHPVFLSGQKDWDEELLNLVDPVCEASNDDQVNEILEYSRAAEPPVQCGVSHLSRRTEPHCL